MVKTKLITAYYAKEGHKVSDQINEFLTEKKITKEQLIDIKFSARDGETFEYPHNNALIIYDDC